MKQAELTQREIELKNQILGLIKKIRYNKLNTPFIQLSNTEIPTWEAKDEENVYTYSEKQNGKLLIRSLFINEKEVKFGQVRNFIRKLDNAIKKGCKIGSRSKPKNSEEESAFFKLIDENLVTKVSAFEYVSIVSDENPDEYHLYIEIKPTPQGGKKTYRRLYKNALFVSERAKLIYCEKHFA